MDRVRQWTVLTALGVVVVLVAGWMLVISHQRSQASALRAQVTEQQSANDALQTQVDVWRSKEADLPKQQAELGAIQVKIPDNPALPSLIRVLSGAADDSGVDLVSLAPGPPTLVAGVATGAAPAAGTASGAASGSAGTAATAGATQAVALDQISVQIGVTGAFFNLEQFASELEQLDRALVVDGFSINPGVVSKGDAAPAAKTPDGQLTEQIQARVFMTAAAATTSPAAPAGAPTAH